MELGYKPPLNTPRTHSTSLHLLSAVRARACFLAGSGGESLLLPLLLRRRPPVGLVPPSSLPLGGFTLSLPLPEDR